MRYSTNASRIQSGVCLLVSPPSTAIRTTAKPGDFVNFIFSPKNHTVTQSSFDDPCTPLQNGFTSGFRPVAANLTTDFPVFTIPVLDSKPIWFHCEQGAGTNASHCGKGMVGAINTDESKFDQFKQKALAIGASLSGNSTSSPTVHQVSVSNANGNLTYTPPVTYAKPGEVVRFTFFPKNHTVSQSSFDSPCSPLDYGFTSGFHPVAPGSIGSETFDITVKDDKPIWFYCQQGANTNASHCGKGMVGAINPTADKTFQEFLQKALAVGVALNANSTIAPTVHQVSVSNANGDLTYTPSVTYAKPGEIVRFTFFPKNHTVSQSAFDSPCSPLDYGFTSGFRPVAPGAASTETFDIVVKDDKPIWFYCQQGANTNATHCGKGMVGAINPTADKTFAAFQQKALAVGAALNANASSAPVYHDVSVGGQDGSLVYTPSSVIAKKGDIVRFTFNPKNHSVTQSSFDEPCTKIQGAIDSGFHPVSPNTYGGPVIFTVPVIDDSPKWFYCAQGAGTNASHCGHGMVFALNPTADKTFAAFRSKALAVGQSLGVIAPIPL
ncbi:Cupredoxin [Irpex rosettiformis]|uniref:Cupredoxin n=1 Tax=Irpex rosettiformis TaxID=378272 RepID=A0ACB8U5E3_9APHY|nr:Cupredoxin [Irpex rosettiformis]